LLIKCAMQI